MRMKKTDDADLTATLLDLIRRGYIAIDGFEESKTSDFTLERTETSTIDLLPHERSLITWFFDHIGRGKTVTTRQIKDYGKQGINEANQFQSDARAFVKAIK